METMQSGGAKQVAEDVWVRIPEGFTDLPAGGWGGPSLQYCGFGRHPAGPPGEFLTSVLTLSVREFEQPRRAYEVLEDLVNAVVKLGYRSEFEIVDLDCGAALFIERVLDRDQSRVFQIQGYVVPDTGTHLATIELSTTNADRGAHFRPMVTLMAMTMRFGQPDAEEPPA